MQIKENFKTQGIVHSYIHTGSRVGVLLEVLCDSDFLARTKEFIDFADEIALQITATSPLYVNREQVSNELVEKQLEIFKEESKDKPEKIIPNIVKGKMDKWYGEICLMDQQSVRDPSKKISQLVLEFAKISSEKIKIRRFQRFDLSEEIE